MARRTRFAARLYRVLGEQRIDIVMTVSAGANPSSPDLRPVVAAALEQGLELART